ncbi:patatin family protein [Caproiciproducens sp. NJN-50]|uniref:patatin-like phospholipase family protein n=1 Tax=Acutalibacteraceae TaxID=3082771 RepID=UPI000FFE1066|nr:MULTISPECIES: patatin family protein [Acutalibacteraceae]QAT50900.1 patatin family protein [Caproiciproducens sp. NJN-50]
MTGVIDVGGGLRGIYGAGVFDYCLDHGIEFDYCIGVSAGSANIASFLGKQKGRNYRFYMEYAFRRQYMSLHNLIHTGSYIDMDYVYGELSNLNGENPLNYEAIKNSHSQMKVVALNAVSGGSTYFDKNDMAQDSYHILKASSSIPVVCRPYSVDGIPYYDGGIADPVPIRKAFGDGCDRVAVILTKPRDTVRVQKKDAPFARLLRRRYPKAAENLLLRYRKYNEGVALAKDYAKRGKALIIAPDDCCGMSTLTKKKSCIDQMYRKGYADARALPAFLHRTDTISA